MKLYHGTSLRKWALIQEAGSLEPAPYGDQHVSFTTCPEVAAYFAHGAWSIDDCDELGMVILKVHTASLARHSITPWPFSSDVWGPGECDWECEWAVAEPVPVRLISVHSSFGRIARHPSKRTTQPHSATSSAKSSSRQG